MTVILLRITGKWLPGAEASVDGDDAAGAVAGVEGEVDDGGGHLSPVSTVGAADRVIRRSAIRRGRTAVRDRRRRARCVPGRPVDAGESQPVADTRT
jgi:hypothetical protein